MKKILILLICLVCAIFFVTEVKADESTLPAEVTAQTTSTPAETAITTVIAPAETTAPETSGTTSLTTATPETSATTTAVTSATSDTTTAVTSAASGTGGGTVRKYFSRLAEFFGKYRAEVLEVASFLILLAVYLVNSFKNAKKLAKLQSGSDMNFAGQTAVAEATNGLIDAYNALSDETKETVDKIIAEYNDFSKKVSDDYKKLAAEYEKMRATYELYGQTENDRNRVIGAVMAQSTAVLEILQLVYANSGKLPQGVKDLINLKYANTLGTIAKDEKLLEIVNAVRENINAVPPGKEHTDEQR